MSRLFNSLQFQLYATFALIGALFIGSFLLTAKNANDFEIIEKQFFAATYQRSNAYLLASLARRLAAAEDGTTRQSIESLLEESIESTDEIQTALRFGGEGDEPEEEIEPIRQPEVLLLLSTLDNEWQEYRALLEEFAGAAQTRQNELLSDIDEQSIVVYTFADRLVSAMDTVQDIELEANQNLLTTFFVTAVVALGVSTFIILRSTRSIYRLGETASTFAAGHLDAKADEQTVSEIAFVGKVFNTMAERLRANITQLQDSVKEAREARAAAERSDQVKSAFLASMSHELRTPLNSIINFTKFVAKGTVGPVNEEQQELLNDVIDGAKHLLGLINDVLDMSKIESGSLKLFVEDNVDLTPILNSVTVTGKNLLDDKPVTIQTAIEPNLPPMRGDRQRILQILLNIMSNACKFTESGSITLNARAAGDMVEISVTDTGPGIHTEDLQGVFEPFKQTRSGLREGGGTGLGMPISKNLAEAHGGKLWLESEVGKGTTFYVTLPVKSEALTPVNLLEGVR